MENPFDEEKKKEEHHFFKEMTDAINTWMLKQYPAFDEPLTRKIKELNSISIEARDDLARFKAEMIDARKSAYSDLNKHVSQFLDKEHPGISTKMVQTCHDMESLLKKMEKEKEYLKEQTRKIVDCQCLYEDVYKMRDQMKEVMKEWEVIKKKMKKLFD